MTKLLLTRSFFTTATLPSSYICRSHAKDLFNKEVLLKIMKCVQCGMPLSPTRTNCPRCGTPAGKPAGKVRLTRDSSPTPPRAKLHTDIDTISKATPVWPSLTPPITPTRDTPSEQEAFPIPAGSFFPSVAPSNVAQAGETAQAQNYDNVRAASPEPFYRPAPPPQPMYPTKATASSQPKTKLGFTVAGMCFITGIIILVFVFIMAQSLPSNTTTASIPTPPKPRITLPTPTPALPTPTSVQTTPTPTSNQYINNVGLASSVDTSTGQAIQPATEFHTNQAIYVTMTIQQLAYTGAVCLEWSVNNQVYPYASAATPGGASYLTQTNAYFFYRPGTIGTGKVSISWASTTDCTDKVLIQSLPFSVIA
jgi:hypothetical protein